MPAPIIPMSAPTGRLMPDEDDVEVDVADADIVADVLETAAL